MKPFSSRLLGVMKERGWTQMEAARQLNVSQALISQYLSGDRTPLPRTIAHIAERLGVPPDELSGTTSPTSLLQQKTGEVDLDSISRKALKNLQRRWNRKPGERATVHHLIEALFPEDAEVIIEWLNKNTNRP